MTSLQNEIEALPDNFRARLARYHFDQDRLLSLTAGLAEGDASNRVTEDVTVPASGDVTALPEPGSSEEQELSALGRQAMSQGQVGLVVMAGGMATRMGGVVKALVEVSDSIRFLDIRLQEAKLCGANYGKALPLFIMTSAATDDGIREALRESEAPDTVQCFSQELSLRVTPTGSLFCNADGTPSEHAPGHGDLPDALRRSGLLDSFIRDGGKYLRMPNLDNLGATLDEGVVGFHIRHGQALSCEVVDKLSSDRGGIPVRRGGRAEVLEEFRLPEGFDANSVPVFNTNTFLVNATALQDLNVSWSFFQVTKTVDDRSAVQFERLVGELTSFLDTRFLLVPRTGKRSRFLPVKSFEELQSTRHHILDLCRSRGLLP